MFVQRNSILIYSRATNPRKNIVLGSTNQWSSALLYGSNVLWAVGFIYTNGREVFFLLHSFPFFFFNTNSNSNRLRLHIFNSNSDAMSIHGHFNCRWPGRLWAVSRGVREQRTQQRKWLHSSNLNHLFRWIHQHKQRTADDSQALFRRIHYSACRQKPAGRDQLCLAGQHCFDFERGCHSDVGWGVELSRGDEGQRVGQRLRGMFLGSTLRLRVLVLQGRLYRPWVSD